MACIRKRRGKWVVDYRDATGHRRWVTCETRRQAEAVLEQKLPESRYRARPAVDPDITVSAYSERWLRLHAAAVKPRSLDIYRTTLRVHIFPTLGPVKLRLLIPGQIKMLLAEKVSAGLARNTVRLILRTLAPMLDAAVDDRVLVANPARQIGKKLKLTGRASERQEEIKAFTREQLAVFLATAERMLSAVFYAFFLLVARTGMRVGEALGLQWADIAFPEREIRVARTVLRDQSGTPKSGLARTVDMSQQLTRTLLKLHVQRKAETLRQGWPEVPPWVFCTPEGQPLAHHMVERAFKRVLKAAKLPPHFTPHCLRHTYASLLLQQGESPVYVQRQLGHSSITLTVDLYGRWLPMGNKAVVDRLDEGSGSKTVAVGEPADSEVADFTEAMSGSGGRRRTSQYC